MRKIGLFFLMFFFIACAGETIQVSGNYICNTDFYSSVFNQQYSFISDVEIKKLNDTLFNVKIENKIDTLIFDCNIKLKGKSAYLWIIPKKTDETIITSNREQKHDAEITNGVLKMEVRKSTFIYDEISTIPVEWLHIYNLKGKIKK